MKQLLLVQSPVPCTPRRCRPELFGADQLIAAPREGARGSSPYVAA
jgi:hypothetical protein